MAEHYFRVIYQSYPRKDVQNIVTYTRTSEGKNVYYIPTPADYVYHVSDCENMLQRLRNSAAKKQAVSLFYHPTLDIKEREFMVLRTDDVQMTRSWALAGESVLARLVNGVNDMGYSFTYFE
jgi:hypothetical protein